MSVRPPDRTSGASRDRRQQLRQERRDFDEQQRQSAHRRDLMVMVGGGAAIIAIVAVLILVLYTQSNVQMGETLPDEGTTHVQVGTPITYERDPPASGTHFGTPSPWGVFDEPVAEGAWVHNLEHGGIVLLFTCEGEACVSAAEQVRGVFNGLPKGKWGNVKFLGTPYNKTDSQMKTPFMLVSWNRQMALDSLNVDTIRDYYRAYADRGPEDVP